MQQPELDRNAVRRPSQPGDRRIRTGSPRLPWGVVLLLVALSSLARPAFSQERRAILWLVEVAPDATVDRNVVAGLFRDLLATATDSEHIVEVEGLADYLRRHGMPVPGCLAGISPCPSVAQSVADELRLDIIATVRVYGQGNRMTLTVSSVTPTPSRLLQFEAENLREAAFRVVTDFVGASGMLFVTSRPTGATVYLEEEEVGQTPFQAQVPVAIYDVRVTLDGYQTHQETIEIRPEESRVLDLELLREYAQLLVQTITPGAALYLDGQLVPDFSRPLRLQPGSHTIRLEAIDYLPSERRLELEPASDNTVRIDLVESPEARRRRLMGYIYERPFYVRGAFRYQLSRSGFSESTGEIGPNAYTVRCPRSDDGGCASDGIVFDTAGFEAEIGYSFKYFEIGLLSITLAGARISSPSGGAGSLILTPNLPDSGSDQEEEGLFTGVTRLELHPFALGARALLTNVWSVYLHGGFGWYIDFFDVEDPTGARGGFDRDGFLWSVDAGLRVHLSDLLFLTGAFLVGDDLSHDDSDLTLGLGVGLGVTWEDVIGFDTLFGGQEAPRTLDTDSSTGLMVGREVP